MTITLLIVIIALLVCLLGVFSVQLRSLRGAQRSTQRPTSPFCPATRIYDMRSSDYVSNQMHGKWARCCLTEDHRDGNVWLHYDPVYNIYWSSGQEAFTKSQLQQQGESNEG